jgi:hypothetical protein
MILRRRSLSLSGDRAAAAAAAKEEEEEDVEEADGEEGTRGFWLWGAGEAAASAAPLGREEEGVWVFWGGVVAGSLEMERMSADSRSRKASIADAYSWRGR